MKQIKDKCSIAVIQASAVMFDKDACLAKALKLIDEAAANGISRLPVPDMVTYS